MKVAVVGAGAVGGYFGARLAQGGEDVHFLARGAHLAAMRERGLQIRSVLGDLDLGPSDTHATDNPADIGPSQVVLFTVKSYDTESASTSLPPLLGPESVVISLQNGIDNEEKLAAGIGAGHVAGGAAYIFAGIAEPGVVRHTPRLEAFLAACQGAGIDARLVDDIRVALWTKYILICAQSGLTAATRQPLGVVRETPPSWNLFRQVLEEGVNVARAEGVAVPDDLVERTLTSMAALPPTLYSSLYDDLVAGRRMEVETLQGELSRRAQRAGVPAPATSALYAVLLAQVPVVTSET